MVRYCPETCGWCNAVVDKLQGSLPPTLALREMHQSGYLYSLGHLVENPEAIS